MEKWTDIIGFEPKHVDYHSFFISVFSRFYFQSTRKCTLLITDWLLLIFSLSWEFIWKLMKSLTENLISSRWTNFALLNKITTEMGSETTHRERLGLAVQRLNHSATLSVQSSKYEIFFFSFLISVDSNSNRPVDAHFWSEIDYCWFFPILIVCLEIDEIFFTEKLVSRLLSFFLLIEKMDRDRIRNQARWLSFLFRFCF